MIAAQQLLAVLLLTNKDHFNIPPMPDSTGVGVAAPPLLAASAIVSVSVGVNSEDQQSSGARRQERRPDSTKPWTAAQLVCSEVTNEKRVPDAPRVCCISHTDSACSVCSHDASCFGHGQGWVSGNCHYF